MAVPHFTDESCKDICVRRSLAGLLFAIASLFGGLAISGFWLQYTAFSPSHSESAAKVVLQDNAIKAELARVIATATGAQLGVDPALVDAKVKETASNPAGAALMAKIVAQAHAVMIGEANPPVQITPQQLVEVLRDERAAALPAVTLPIEKVTVLSLMRQTLRWLVPIAGLAALVLLLLGFAAHPDRPELMKSLSYMLLAFAAFLVVIGYLVPVFLLPKLTKNVWVAAAPRLARDSLPLLASGVAVLVGAAGLCFALAGSTRHRDRWSQPVHRNRHEADRRWS
jgi:hypothetical protein